MRQVENKHNVSLNNSIGSLSMSYFPIGVIFVINYRGGPTECFHSARDDYTVWERSGPVQEVNIPIRLIFPGPQEC